MDTDDLPFIDEHAITIDASRERVWAALQRYAATSLRFGEGSAFAKLLGTDPPAGFEVSETVPEELLSLTGRHRFSRYRLAFDLTGAEGGPTRLRASSYGAFPGLRGRVYRALVIGTRGHVVATNHILLSVRRLCVAEGGA